MNRGTKKAALLAMVCLLVLPAAKAKAQTTTCASIHQVPAIFSTTNSIRQAGIDWHKDLSQSYSETWQFKVEHNITSHKFQLEFMEHITTTAQGCNTNPTQCLGENAGETCQVPACAPTLKVILVYPDGRSVTLKAVRQPGLESLLTGTVPLNGSQRSIVYFLDEDRTTVTVLVPEDSQYGRMIPVGSKIKVTVAVPALLGGQCQELCGKDVYILGSKQRSCQMSYLNCEPCVGAAQ
ncbi:MAG: hypothetical protein HZA78_07075 [Candidatus Schekmanbacteria bacterium]|nr:hypothetical protein [Candidatus Schekmanbacteria bacterium]